MVELKYTPIGSNSCRCKYNDLPIHPLAPVINNLGNFIVWISVSYSKGVKKLRKTVCPNRYLCN